MRRWIVPAVLGLVALSVIGFWGYSQFQANRSLENFLANQYRRAFFDMSTQVQNLEVMLSKSLVVSDPRLDSALFMDIRQQAAFAQSNLGQLPLNDALAGRTAKFLTQVGDFADSLARQVGQGNSVSSRQWDTLNNLYQQSVQLNQELQGIHYNVQMNNYYFGSLVHELRRSLARQPGNLAVTDFQVVDKQMQQYPTLIYDGPFSEHLERTEPKVLSGKPEVTPEEALERGLAFLDRQPGAEYHAEVTGNNNGRIPSYRVEVTPPGGGEARTLMDVSRQGGRVVWMLSQRPLGEPALEIDQAGKKAEEFLKQRNFGDMRPTYYMRSGNSVTFNFAALQNQVTLYPDLVKVTVALDNGEVIGAETSGYLMSHRTRELPGVKLTEEQARAVISPRLEVTGGKLALIPSGVLNEILTYEFQGNLGEEKFLIYVNALDGREERVIKLIDTPGGTLAM